MEDTYNIDIAVIGSGAAGCTAAIEAHKLNPKIVLITKTNMMASNTALAQGGIQAAISKDDSPAIHFADIIEAGQPHCDPALVELMTYRAPKTISWLKSIGVRFDKKDGEFILKKGAGMSRPRLLSIGDKTGFAIMSALKEHIVKSKIPVMEFFSLDTMRLNGKNIQLTVKGPNRNITINCKSLVLAAGGSSYKRALDNNGVSTNHKNATGDVLMLAKKMGVELVDENMFQDHPTVVAEPEPMVGIPVPETIRSYGAQLINNKGESFVYELTSRIELSKAIIDEFNKGLGFTSKAGRPCVKLTTQEVDKHNYDGFLAEHFPGIYQRFKRFGINISKEPIFVYPALHYQLGGIKIGTKAQTNIPGIYAAGEITGGIHGKERLIGNALLDALVFGRISGRSAAQYSLSI